MLKILDPMVLDMLILDSRGGISNWTGRGEPPDVSAMGYARLPADEAPEPPAPFAPGAHAPEVLRVSGPHESPVQPGRMCFAASMPLRGSLRGEYTTLVVLLDLELLHRRFGEVDLPPGAAIAVSTPSGEMLSSSVRGSVAGRKVPELAALWKGEASRGVRTLSDPVEGREFITAFTKVPMNGLLALGFRDKGMLLEQWRAQAVRTVLAWLALACFVAPVTCYSMRDQVRMARMAATDGLTGLPNRATFMRTGREELERARRYGHDTAALIIDIDHFKRVNDTHGHDVGDLAIQALARILAGACRSTDLPCRYGGEEFAMLLPETGAEGALAAAEKVRAMVEAERVPAAPGPVRLTCSVGAAVWRGGDEELDELLKRADTALYAAKEGGRNQVRQG
jgi:diguanylate cyclase (GGDEF)-like protein